MDPAGQTHCRRCCRVDHFGDSVALSGDTALVGVPHDDTAAGTNAGSAYVFARSGECVDPAGETNRRRQCGGRQFRLFCGAFWRYRAGRWPNDSGPEEFFMILAVRIFSCAAGRLEPAGESDRRRRGGRGDCSGCSVALSGELR